MPVSFSRGKAHTRSKDDPLFNVFEYVFMYICAQAFSASLKRSLNLSANTVAFREIGTL
jgi:hypothetical protein